MTTLDVVVGGLYGSEAKGHATQRLTERRIYQFGSVEVIRVAGPNAGHTGHDDRDRPWAFRQLPVATVVPGAVELGIAAGSEIDLPVLLEEIDAATTAGLLDSDKTIWVSQEATLISEQHKADEASLVGRIGSTGKGIGAARAARINRTALRLGDSPAAMAELQARGVALAPPTPKTRYDRPLIIEGTQGFGLGLHAGYYPQCTSSDCRAIDFLAMAGVNPWQFTETEVRIWVVARMYPIRVAGNSGPMLGETSWDALGLPEERTTVTKKVRRVGAPDWDLVRRAVDANGPRRVELAVFMADQMFPELAGKTDPSRWLSQDHRSYLESIRSATGAPVALLGTGPNSAMWLNGVDR